MKASNGTDTLVQDSEYWGRRPSIKRKYVDLAAEITALSIRGYSRLIMDQITGRVRCTRRGGSPLLDRALCLMGLLSFPHAIDVVEAAANEENICAHVTA